MHDQSANTQALACTHSRQRAAPGCHPCATRAPGCARVVSDHLGAAWAPAVCMQPLPACMEQGHPTISLHAHGRPALCMFKVSWSPAAWAPSISNKATIPRPPPPPCVPRRALPSASGTDNICVAFSKVTTASGRNFILCNGAGYNSFNQTFLVTPDARQLPVRCDPTVDTILKMLVESSLSSRPDVALAVAVPGKCELRNTGHAEHTQRVSFYVS